MPALIDTVPTTRPVLPSVVAGHTNGKLPADLMRNFDGRGSLLTIVSYGMQALHLQAWADNVEGFGPIDTETTGRYRTFERQVALVHERMSTTWRPNATTRYVAAHYYAGKFYAAATWYLLPGQAMVATPGTSNHGWGSADDVAEENNGRPGVDGMSDRQLRWMRDNAPSFGFGLESRKERWHWHWTAGDVLPERAVRVLRFCGVEIDLPGYEQPNVTPKDDEQMYLANLSGNVVVVGSSVRPVSGGEYDVLAATLKTYSPDPESAWYAWLEAARIEYAARIGMG
jgi:hypothetical protein